MTIPTRSELFDLIRSFGYTTSGQTDEIAAALLAKWGQPQAVASGELVGFVHAGQLANIAEGYAYVYPKRVAGASVPLYTAPPRHALREPLTRDQVKAIMVEAGYDREAPQPRADFINGLRHGERHHGITKGGQHGAE